MYLHCLNCYLVLCLCRKDCQIWGQRLVKTRFLFMLKKDWKYTGLDSYVGAAYCIDKKAEEAFALIRKMEEL